MKRIVPMIAVLLASILGSSISPAQTELVQNHFSPASLEFVELRAVVSERELAGVSSLNEFPEGALLAEAGFQKYSRRTYETSPAGGLSIEIITLKDAKAA